MKVSRLWRVNWQESLNVDHYRDCSGVKNSEKNIMWKKRDHTFKDLRDMNRCCYRSTKNNVINTLYAKLPWFSCQGIRVSDYFRSMSRRKGGESLITIVGLVLWLSSQRRTHLDDTSFARVRCYSTNSFSSFQEGGAEVARVTSTGQENEGKREGNNVSVTLFPNLSFAKSIYLFLHSCLVECPADDNDTCV